MVSRAHELRASFASAIGTALGDFCIMKDRLEEVERILRNLIEDYDDENGGIIVMPDRGCVICTEGTTPDKYNTGLCDFHKAKKLLGMPL